MRFPRFFLCILLGSCVVGNVTLANAQPRQDTRLVLQLTVDGLRADLLNRYQESFGKDGFQYLLRQGTVYTNVQSIHRLVHPVDVAPTIAAFLGMTPPAAAQGTPLKEALK